ncbi:MAG: restriction endonuclease [Candidatus Portnoybacteria bacterium]|nr:restriction endonuclease [Candidatus Portnoybacteria bacterium]MDD4982775.1 restriction endonuclease [Candidatus Portnoybacteria bacterium]
MFKKRAITSEDFQQYRQKLGFTNQAAVKDFFGAKDITPSIDFDYIKFLNKRIYNIVDRLNAVVADEVKVDNMCSFKKEHIDLVLKKMKRSGILPLLNNQGRRPEQVYFSWMRGYVISNFFLKALEIIFEVDIVNIDLVGDDDFKNIETFRRTPKADLEIKSKKIRIEMQSGFTSINDIKKHKVTEAKKVFLETGIQSLAIHFDLYNGQVAFVKLDEIEDGDVNWITRINLDDEEIVWNIDQNFFFWNLENVPLPYQRILENYYA